MPPMRYIDQMEALSAACELTRSASHLLVGQVMDVRHNNNPDQLRLDDIRQLLQRALDNVDKLRAG